ncbi:MAG: DEAD/DEAH box helicase [Planctomycetota bacterium]|nr:DEAD/DEAH box helicase [Planctomycetota bacterium]MDA1163309.1 DEAD/DEAH box helicase [Planctomycetota bacterium]
MKTFAELDLIPAVRRALADEKYEIPTPIQAQTVPAALLGKDVLGCAQTGTGKTAAFALPILNRLGQQDRKATPNRPLVLVLAPTRELAIQIGDSFATYGKHLALRHALVYGGVSQVNQVRALNRGAHILVATPGRLIDLMNQGYVELDQLEVFVLDEADRMLDMGFLPDLKRIIKELPNQRQSLFFSATMPPKITELSQSLLRKPVSVNVTPKQTSVERIEQQVFFVERTGKRALLQQVLSGSDVDRAIVFTKTKRGANMLAQKLLLGGVKAAAIHGNKSQGARQRALEAFRQKQVEVLVATDVAARGIDIDGVTHVINYDMPLEPESYVHRIGRTGRAGAEGMALSFCSADERGDLRAIENLIGQKVPLAPNQPKAEPPTAADATDRKPASQARGRRNSGPKRPTSTATEAQQTPNRNPAEVAGGGDTPKPRRRRKTQQRRQRTKQTT